MSASPRDKSSNVIPGDVRQQLVLAEELDHQRESSLGIDSARSVLPVLLPEPASYVVEPQRGVRLLGLRDQCLRALVLGRLYFFGFAFRRLLCTSEKATISDLEIVLPERRARVASDGHGESFRVCTVMNSLRSAS